MKNVFRHFDTSDNQLEPRPGCIKSALKILGDKWSALLLKELASTGKTFSDLELALTNISPRTLSQRLRKLMALKIIVKKQYCAHPVRYTYHLTSQGRELVDILRAMAVWGEKHR